jgi:hypothetical protein
MTDVRKELRYDPNVRALAVTDMPYFRHDDQRNDMVKRLCWTCQEPLTGERQFIAYDSVETVPTEMGGVTDQMPTTKTAPRCETCAKGTRSYIAMTLGKEEPWLEIEPLKLALEIETERLPFSPVLRPDYVDEQYARNAVVRWVVGYIEDSWEVDGQMRRTGR